jgi:hypothetical protein
MKIPGIDKALAEGCRLHVFRRGASRVARMERSDSLESYGENFTVHHALLEAGANYLRHHPRLDYISADSRQDPSKNTEMTSVQMEDWVQNGNSLDVWSEKGEVVFQFNRHADGKISEATRTARGKDFWSAMEAAISAPEINS